MSSDFVSINKHGKDYSVRILESLNSKYMMKERKKADSIVHANVVSISLSKDADLILLTHRWERLLDDKFKQWSDYILNPKKFAPPFKFIMFMIFKLMESIYFDCYGPDYLMTKFYKEKLIQSAFDEDDTEEIMTLKRKLPHQFLNLWNHENVSKSLDVKKSLFDYLESKQFNELLQSDLFVAQMSKDYSGTRLESDVTK
jgi:hypothetical protein